MKRYLIVLLLAIAGAMWIYSGSEDKVNKMEHQHYCQMVKQWKATDGLYGWPDYKHEECGK